MRTKPRLGRHLEWHGNRIRVVVRVPPSLVPTIKRTKLRETLATNDPLEAEREKVDVIRRLRGELRGERVTIVQKPLAEEALTWREEIRRAKASGSEGTIGFALDARVDLVRAEHGHDAAAAFASVASGAATPVAALLDRMFAEKKLSIGYEQDIRRSVARLETWCLGAARPATIEAIGTEVAGLFVHEHYVLSGVDVGTANKEISCLHSYWKWMKKRAGIQENPWIGQRLAEKNSREAAEQDSDKRPFTDDEVRTLLGGIRLRREWDMSLLSALSGLRVHEIAALRVKDCSERRIAVTKSKTPSGVRTIPAHPLLTKIIERRSEGKKPTDFLFDELPEQRHGSKRERSAPVSQAFTRERRRLGIEEKGSEKQRQSNIDFHSWRRWFVRRAVEALERGGVGYTPWTIAHVVGHKVEDGTIEGQALPLGMTMGVYAGAASWEAMTACVHAVTLPKDTLAERHDFVLVKQGRRRPSTRSEGRSLPRPAISIDV
ncbi:MULTISPECIES: hypothetical protein [unclassified Bradyrhizobium]|uniref:tyrosine-type recombinase/integrase n=1 Tax=unclassified Bradyrhizobium TaxID=2631580 RepID=UPI0029160269|nr:MULTISPECIES: hypothetical protein [unclassified Bradyrhizobium]